MQRAKNIDLVPCDKARSLDSLASSKLESFAKSVRRLWTCDMPDVGASRYVHRGGCRQSRNADGPATLLYTSQRGNNARFAEDQLKHAFPWSKNNRQRAGNMGASSGHWEGPRCEQGIFGPFQETCSNNTLLDVLRSWLCLSGGTGGVWLRAAHLLIVALERVQGSRPSLV
jgi:hypothetical protein